MIERDEAARSVRRVGHIALVGHLVYVAVMTVATVDSASVPFALLDLGGLLGAVAALLLATSTVAIHRDRITAATAVMAVGFVAGAAAAALGGSPAYLLPPAVLLLVNGLVVGAARRVHTLTA